MKNRAWNIPWPLLCAALALIQLVLVGYTIGYGNQSVQMPYLQHLIDPALFPHDPLLHSLEHYPSSFYRALAWILTHTGGIDAIPTAYLLLHAVAAYLVLYAASSIARSLTGREGPALLLLLILLGGHHAGIAESGLYSLGFTHTWLALGVALLALAMVLAGRVVSGCLLAGLLFNVHALLAAYTMVFIGATALVDWRGGRWWRYLAGCCLAAGTASPTLAFMLFDHGSAYDAEWMELLRIRSAHHVFPSAWWTAANFQIPRFATTVAIAAIGGACLPAGAPRRALGAITAAGLLLFAAGACFVEVIPIPIVMRAQLFRASQLLLPMLLAGMAMASWYAMAHAIRPAPLGEDPGEVLQDIFGRLAGALLGGSMFLAYAVPGLETWRLPLLLAGALTLLAAGQLPWWAAAATSGALVINVAAYAQLGMDLLPHAAPLTPLVAMNGQMVERVGPYALPLLAIPGFAAIIRRPWQRLLLQVGSAALVILLGSQLLPGYVQRAVTAEETPWTDMQRVVRHTTPPDATLLTPPRQSGFRIHSRRGIAGEWRDGTQQFFDPDFARAWFTTMKQVMPDLQTAPHKGITHPGRPLETCSARELLEFCETTGSEWLVLPLSHPKPLVECYANDQWRLYRAELLPPPPPPAGVVDTNAWYAQEAFMLEVVHPNIERYRKRDVDLRVSAADGTSVLGRHYRIVQTDSEFGFGSALELFKQPPGDPPGFSRTLVTPPQLARFRDIFNYSIIGYSGKWNVFEPEKDQPDFADLDAYVDWCHTNNIRLQYHFVSGYEPEWVKSATPEDQAAFLLKHTGELIDRYGERVEAWQVVNEKRMLHHAVPAFKLLRERLPGAPLGISACARFYDVKRRSQRRKDQTALTDAERTIKQLCFDIDLIDWFAERGVKVDFFAFHGHRPFGLWAEPEKVYAAFDAYADKGVRIHVSEFGIPVPAPMVGDLRHGEWTRELQAEYYRRIYSVIFSHPAVDVINLWGMSATTWIKGAGLVDAEGNPNASYDALHELIHTTWRTRLEGKLPIDGHLSFRGFHGDYEVYLDNVDTPTTTFTLSSTTNTPLQLQIPLPR